jgi:DNA modification methylase
MDSSIFYGNCVDVLAKLPEEFIDLVVTSPPYDNIRKYNGYEFDCEKIAQALLRTMKQGGVVVWVVGDAVIDGSETGTSFRQALTFMEVGFKLHDTMIYEKNTSSFPARRNGKRYTQIFEYMFVFSKGTPKTVNLICDKPNKWVGWTNWGKNTERGRDGVLNKKKDIKPVELTSPRNNIWRYIPLGYKDDPKDLPEFYRYVPVFEKNEKADEEIPSSIRRYVVGGKFGQKDDIAYEHPGTFPEHLAYDHIISWSNPGDIVLDPMCGSGTTGKVALKEKRLFFGIDISKDYCLIAAERTKLPVIILKDDNVKNNSQDS